MVEFNIMWTDVVDLNDFYGSSLGQTAGRIISRRARAVWPNVQGMVVAGIGYSTPFLWPFRDEAERVIAVMPAGQGVMHWPAGEPSLVVLADGHGGWPSRGRGDERELTVGGFRPIGLVVP